MGSLYYSGDGTSRFRVWAPFAAQIDVILDHPIANTPSRSPTKQARPTGQPTVYQCRQTRGTSTALLLDRGRAMTLRNPTSAPTPSPPGRRVRRRVRVMLWRPKWTIVDSPRKLVGAHIRQRIISDNLGILGSYDENRRVRLVLVRLASQVLTNGVRGSGWIVTTNSD